METYNKKVATNPMVEMIHVSLDRDKASAEKWAAEAGLPWPTVLPEKIPASGLSKFSPTSVPAYYLLDRNGKKLAEGKAKVFKKAAQLTDKEA